MYWKNPVSDSRQDKRNQIFVLMLRLCLLQGDEGGKGERGKGGKGEKGQRGKKREGEKERMRVLLPYYNLIYIYIYFFLVSDVSF